MAIHFFKRDLRRAWWLYSIWLLVYLAEGLFAVSISPKVDGGVASNMALSFIMFPVLRILVLVVLVAQLVHEDPLVGSTAFWLTRPVSRFSLFLSKAAGLGIVVLIPVVVNTAVLSRFGLLHSELRLAAVGILAHQCSFVLPIAAVAALTPNFRFYGAAAAGMAVGIGVILIATSTGIGGSAVVDPYANIALLNTRAMVAESLLIGGGALILTHQYLARRTRRSIALAAFVAVAYILIAGYWPWSVVRDTPIRSEHPPFDPTPLKLRVFAAQLNDFNVNGHSAKRIDGSYSLDGIPTALFVRVRTANPKLTLPDGTAVETFNSMTVLPWVGGFSKSDLPALGAALEGIPVDSYYDQGGSMTTLAYIDNGALQKFKDSPAKLVDDFDLVAGRYEVAAEIPIVKGRQFEVGRVRFRIEDLISRPDGVTLNILESVVLVSPSFSIRLGPQPFDPRLKGDPVYFLVNRSRREAVPFNLEITRRSVGEFYLGGMLFQQAVEMPFGGGRDPQAPVVDRNWLAGATFVCLERVPVFEFRKTAEVDLLKLGEPWLRAKTPEILK
jgi:ABC-type transport system involved in multi-copper enzyme maturation permease subunit